MLVKDIASALESVAPLARQESYDNSGLICGSPAMEVKAVLLSIDCTEEVLDEAITGGCNMIVSHHPVLFTGIKKITGRTYVERVIIKAIKNDIALYAAHTNMDNIEAGVNSKIAERIGLANTRILSPAKGMLRKLVTFCPTEVADKVRQALFEAGAGSIGNYDQCSFNAEGIGTFRGNGNSHGYAGETGRTHQEKEVRIETIYTADQEATLVRALLNAHPYEEVAYDLIPLSNTHTQAGSGLIGELPAEEDTAAFLGRLKKQMNTACIRHTPLVHKKVKTVALCGGSGSFLLSDAIAAGAQVVVSADFKYHQFFDAENKIVIADIGHYESEQFTIHLFYDILTKKFPIFAVHLSKINTNPINYF